MKTSKHSRQPSESSLARRRDASSRTQLAQVQAYHPHRIPSSSYYPDPVSVPGTATVADQDMYEVYQAGLLPTPTYHESEVGSAAAKNGSMDGGGNSGSGAGPWYAHQPTSRHPQAEQQQQQQQHEQHEQQQQQQHRKLEARAMLETRHRPSSGAWSVRDDHQLLAARIQGLNWSQIQEHHFPNKSANACRKRHERLVDNKGGRGIGLNGGGGGTGGIGAGGGIGETQRLERIAAEYVGMRQRLWEELARKTGEKWTYVEQKCLSNGLKNLQGIARAANRRHQYDPGVAAAAAANGGAGGSSGGGGYDDDSGISGFGLTPVDEADVYAGGGGGGGGGGSTAGSPHAVAANAAAAVAAAAASAAAGGDSFATAPPSLLRHPLQTPTGLHPPATTGAFSAGIVYSGGGGGGHHGHNHGQHQQHHHHAAYSPSISSDGSLHPGYATRRDGAGEGRKYL